MILDPGKRLVDVAYTPDPDDAPATSHSEYFSPIVRQRRLKRHLLGVYHARPEARM